MKILAKTGYQPKIGDLFKDGLLGNLYFCLSKPYKNKKWDEPVFKAYAFYLSEIRDLVADYEYFEKVNLDV